MLTPSRNDEGSHKTKYRKEFKPLDITAAPDVNTSGQSLLSASAFNPFSYYNAPTPGNVIRQALLASGISYGTRHSFTTYFGLVSSSLVKSADTALCSPALACYTLWRGRQDGNDSMIDASRQLYVHGLVSTQRALSDVQLAKADATRMFEPCGCQMWSYVGPELAWKLCSSISVIRADPFVDYF